jgi:hypothetical protein
VEDVDAGDGVEGDGDVQIQMAGLGVVDAESVEHDEGLLEGGAAEGEVGLNAVGGASLEVERGVLSEEVGDAVGDQRLVSGPENVDGAVAFGERKRLEGGGDGEILGDSGRFYLKSGAPSGRGLLRIVGESGAEAKEAKGEAGWVVSHDWSVTIICRNS